MQSSRRAWSLRLNAAVACLLLSTVGRADSAEPPGRSDSAPAAPSRPSVEYEIDPTRAFGERVVLLVRTPGDDGVITRLRADLGESEWHVLEIRPDERFEPPPLGESAEREGASAAVRVDAKRGAIELWVLRPEGPVEETIVSGQRDEQSLALRVTEVLRARGILLTRPEREIARPPTETKSQGRPTLRVDSTDSRPPRSREDAAWLWLALGPGLGLSPGGLDPLPFAELGIQSEISDGFSVGIVGLAPVSRQTVAAAEGEAEVATWLASGTLELDWGHSSFGGFRSGVGAGVTVTTMAGKARDDFRSAEDTVTAFAPLARSSFHVDLGRSFRLRSAAVVGATFPEVRVAFGSREVASWGRPFVVASIVLETSPMTW